MAIFRGKRVAGAVASPDPQGTCIPDLVTARAAESPRALALTAVSEELTYQELDCRANRLANHLRSLGVGADVLVGLCLPRTLDMVVGALGILKAGGAYVPMDPAYPPARLAFMLDDAHAPALITDSRVAQQLPTAKTRLVFPDAREIVAQPPSAPPIAHAPTDLAYVIYTSGSTGRPKGVEITHQGLANLV